MSRAAINKHVQTLRDWGLMSLLFLVKGYSFTGAYPTIRCLTYSFSTDGGNITVPPVIDSTNQYLITRIRSAGVRDACVAE